MLTAVHFSALRLPTTLAVIVMNCLLNTHLITYVITFPGVWLTYGIVYLFILSFPHLQDLKQFCNDLSVSSYRTVLITVLESFACFYSVQSVLKY